MDITTPRPVSDHVDVIPELQSVIDGEPNCVRRG